MAVCSLIAVALACGRHASVTPQRVDLSPLSAVHPDLSSGVRSSFEDYEALVLGGVQQRTGLRRKDGVIELFTKLYGTNEADKHPFSVDVDVALFKTRADAKRHFENAHRF
jgi:hypothetical protein